MEYKTNPVKAIREKCIECMGYQPNLVKECQIETCAIYPFRMGKNPFRTRRELTPEQKAARAETLRKNRENS